MEITEVKSAIDGVRSAFEEFKKANDIRIAEVEKKGSADPIILEKLDRLNKEMDKGQEGLKALEAEKKAQKERIDLLETALKRGAKSDPEAEKKANNEIVLKAFRDFARAPGKMYFDEFVANKPEIKALTVGSDPDGGYTVLPDTGGRAVVKEFETSPIRQIASVQTISTDALEGFEDRDEASVNWVAETGTRTTTNTPQVGKWRIPVHEIYAMPSASQQALDDSSWNLEGWLAEKVNGKIARTENTAFVSGNGDGKPRGFLDYSSTSTADSSRTWGVLEFVKTGSAGSYGTSTNGADKLIDLVHRMKAAYRGGAVFVMNRATLGTTRQLKDGQGAYIWLPAMTAGQNSSLLGYPIVEAEDMPAIGADTLSVAFGNFRLGYQIVDRQGVRVLRDPYSNKPYVQFYTTKRVGGAVIHPESIKFLKFST